MMKRRIALLVPTSRNTPQILADLTYLAALSSHDVRVFISDSSGDPAWASAQRAGLRHLFTEDLQDGFVLQ
jgi:hypothetical protein